MHRHRLENLILAGAFDSLHEHGRGLLWRLDETLALAATYRAQAGEQKALDFGGIAHIATPCATEIEDLSAWDRFLWEWWTTGVTAGAHVFAYLREALERKRVLTSYDAGHQPQGTRVTAPGLIMRPHRPPTRTAHRWRGPEPLTAARRRKSISHTPGNRLDPIAGLIGNLVELR